MKRSLVKQALADALAARGYDKLTPVQLEVSKPELEGSDLLVSAQTGSGKTVGFGLAIAPTILGEGDAFDRAEAPLALVIAPTRELALQVKREFAWLYAKAGAVVASCVGGMDMRDERRALARGAHIVVATPGRLRDHIMRGSLDLSGLKAVVLDEADEMLDLGFREDLEFILGESPDDRQTLMFSATVPRAIATLAKNYQTNAVRVATTSEASQHADITYRALSVSPRDAENAIINVLRYYESPNAIVFANTRVMVNRLTTRLSNRGFAVVALSGELSQSERTHALQAMRDGRARVCVATDVAARGIDLPNLDLVIHAELPSNHETMLHRSGRTGRAGRKGVSTLIVPGKMRRKAERILQGAKVTAEWGEAPSADAVTERDRERMMADPVWQQEITEGEASAVAALNEAFTPAQLAAGYLRMYSERHSAPEELLPAGDDRGKPRAPRGAFGPSTWFSVSGGRDAGAEPRRLLPMLCKAGGLDKDDIGAIRVQNSESFVEIRNESVDGFLKSIGTNLRLESSTLKKLDTPPAIANSPKPAYEPRNKPPHHRKAGGKPDRGPREERGQHGADPRKEPREKSHKPSKPEHSRPDGVVTSPKARKGKPDSSGPPKGKPSSKKNRARTAAAKSQKGKGKPSGAGAPKRH